MTQAAFGGPIFNARVDLWLQTPDDHIRLCQVGAEFVIADPPCDIPSGAAATVVISIDGKAHHRRVIVMDGLSSDKPKSRVVACDEDHLPF